MKTIKKNVYYCEFCKKKSLAPYVITKHELHCTGNPNRECGMCNNKLSLSGAVAALKTRFILSENLFPTLENWEEQIDANIDEKIVTWTGMPITLEEIKDQYDYCPACVLAILRQTGLNRHWFHFEYNYQEEFKKAYEEKIAAIKDKEWIDNDTGYL